MKPRTVVAMSGGVDSSVAAALLLERGFDVTGVMMRLWSTPSGRKGAKHNRCCTPDQIADARKVAEILGIRFYVLDVQDYFYESVVRYFIEGYARGETPNPCVACNRQIRFDYLLEQAKALGADFLATGHYARIQKGENGFQLLQARDRGKDQSYVLHVLQQSQLQNLQFPIGGYTKSEVRQLAQQFALDVAGKSDSMDLCFVADGDVRSFLSTRLSDNIRAGEITDKNGRTLGAHSGLAQYTIGQRKGLGIAAGYPLYVLEKDVKHNKIVVGTWEELGKRKLRAKDVNWVSGQPPVSPSQFHTKIRYKAVPVKARVTVEDVHDVSVEFNTPVFGVTAGQAVVFYKDEVCAGGGLITNDVVE